MNEAGLEPAISSFYLSLPLLCFAGQGVCHYTTHSFVTMSRSRTYILLNSLASTMSRSTLLSYHDNCAASVEAGIRSTRKLNLSTN